MSESNPYQPPTADAAPSEPPKILYATRERAFWAGARRGAKIAAYIALIGQAVVYAGVIAFDPIMRKGILGEGLSGLLAFPMLVCLVTVPAVFIGGLRMGMVEARRWKRPAA